MPGRGSQASPPVVAVSLIRNNLEMTDVATPITFERYTGNRHGSVPGWLMTTGTVGKRLPKTLPGLDRFYMIGQWQEPGGGVVMLALAGRETVQIICSRDGNEFMAGRTLGRQETLSGRLPFRLDFIV